jgi:inorganic pyrophosphatase
VAKKSQFPRQADPSRLPPYDEDGKGLYVVIETPKGSRNKYAFDKTKAIFLAHA